MACFNPLHLSSSRISGVCLIFILGGGGARKGEVEFHSPPECYFLLRVDVRVAGWTLKARGCAQWMVELKVAGARLGCRPRKWGDKRDRKGRSAGVEGGQEARCGQQFHGRKCLGDTTDEKRKHARERGGETDNMMMLSLKGGNLNTPSVPTK